MESETEIRRYYSRPALYKQIMNIVARTGIENLPRLDEFHIGGRHATGLFLEQLNLRPGMSVLDIGSGLGGPARHAAEAYDVHVTGIDLTPSYTETAALLSQETGFEAKTAFHCINALSLPFPDASFDAAYTIHMSMNIEDKAAMLHEAYRILKFESVFGLYDVLRGTGTHTPVFPLPWADHPDQSFLINHEKLSDLLLSSGCDIVKSIDTTSSSIAMLEKLKISEGAPGLHLLLGDDFREKALNLLTSLKSGACASYMVVSRKRCR